VFLAQFKSNHVRVDRNLMTHTYVCTEESIHFENWDECQAHGSSVEPLAGISNKTLSQAEAYDFISKIDEKVRDKRVHLHQVYYIDSDQEQKFPDWVSESLSKKKQLEEAGFKVVDLVQPAPVIHIGQRVFLNAHKEKVHSEGYGYRVSFPRYANSLGVNGTAFIPEYLIYASKEENAQAKKTYQKYFDQVIPITTDQHVTDYGSIHCLSKEY